LTCGEDKHRVTFEKYEKKDTWKTKKNYMDDISAEIPVGNLNQLMIVRFGTNFALVFGLILITIVILTKEKKKTE